MRSFLLVILSCVVLGAAFFGYSRMQGTPVALREKSVTTDKPPSKPVGGNRIGPVGRGDGVWIEIFDENTGLLVRRLRSAQYKPQKNGLVLLTTPEAEFYMPNRQSPPAPVLKMHLTGLTGEVVIPESPASSKNLAEQPPPASPSRGQIFTVTIQLYNLFADSVPGVVDETITTHNIQFDNETMLISTESYTDTAGNTVAADQVPVKMRSNSPIRGYDMDGRGLRLRWNDKDGRLDLLEIAHGEQLVIKDTASSGAFGNNERSPKSPGATAMALPKFDSMEPARGISSPPMFSATDATHFILPFNATAADPLPLALAANSRGAAGDVVRAKPPAPRPKKPEAPAVPVPYVATFYENVRITQGQEILITADQMDVDFVNRQDNANPATRPTTAPASSQESGDAGTPQSSATAEPTTRPAATREASSATQAAATQPVNTPIVIRWTGKLLMLPAKADRPKVTPGDAIIGLIGKPVVVRRMAAGQDGDDIRSAKVIYHTADGHVKLLNSDSLPQVVISKLVNGQIDPRTTITTSTLDYTSDVDGKKFAVLTGPGHALVPMAADDSNPAKPANGMMDARWKDGAKVYFAGRGQNDLAVEHVDLFGNVDVNNPQLLLKSQELGLFFEPPTKPATRPADASAAAASHPNAASPDGGMVTFAAIPGEHPAAHHPSTQPAKPAAKPQPELRRVLAKQAVHCELAGQNGKKQIIDSDVLDMRTAHGPDGKLFARQINAAGHVHTHDPDQDLQAGILEITLKPAAPKTPEPAAAGMGGPPIAFAENHGRAAHATDIPDEPKPAAHLAQGTGKIADAGSPQTRPAKQESDTSAAELDTLFARDNVRVMNKEGSLATGDELHITTENNQTHVRLIGNSATVVDAKKNIVTGPLITVEAKDGIAHVYGAGTMHVLQEQNDGSRPKPMDVNWTDRADMNGPGNRIDIYGGVALKTLDSDGTVNTANGDKIRIDLMKKATPATQPASAHPAHTSLAKADTRPTTRAAADPMQMDIMKDKDVRTITIDGHSHVDSTSKAADGTLLRNFSLFAPQIIYQLADSKELPAKTVLVPSAGQMLVRDHRPPEKAKADENGKKGENDESSNRGDTAFQWSRQLIYSEAEHRAVMSGNVLIVHKDLDAKQASEGPVHITADEVTAWFQPQTAKLETRPADGPDQPALGLKHLNANGHVVVTRATGARLNGDRIDYDPKTHWMTVFGTDARPAHFEDPDPQKRPISARQFQWNTQTWDIKGQGTSSPNPR